ncbi:MAG: glycerophosphodiester phosphodiesterase family protein [Hyphomicrobiales bacterium]
MRLGQIGVVLTATLVSVAAHLPAFADDGIQLGPRPYYLLDRLENGPLKTKLQSCAAGPFRRTQFSIGHRGAPMQFPEHTRQSYLAAARMGAGILECDVTFTKDRELVCRHSQCDLHTTTNILKVPDLAAKCSEPFTPADPATGRKASAKCCTSDLTLAEFKRLEVKMDAADPEATTVEAYMNATPRWRTDLYASGGELMTHAESIALFKELGVRFAPELKIPDVKMPFEGDYAQEDYAQALIDEYKQAGVPPGDVFAQSFNLEDLRYWIAKEPAFGAQAIYLDGRYGDPDFDHTKPETWSPSMPALAREGVRIIAPPIWKLVKIGEDGRITPSVYAGAAKAAGLDIIAWSLERSGPLKEGGGWYYQSVREAIDDDGDMLTVLDVLASEVGVRGVFSDWPATTTYYASCMALD